MPHCKTNSGSPPASDDSDLMVGKQRRWRLGRRRQDLRILRRYLQLLPLLVSQESLIRSHLQHQITESKKPKLGIPDTSNCTRTAIFRSRKLTWDDKNHKTAEETSDLLRRSDLRMGDKERRTVARDSAGARSMFGNPRKAG
ncbi:hypothetical protein ACLOJK_012130, partial [Asimina triloba]